MVESSGLVERCDFVVAVEASPVVDPVAGEFVHPPAWLADRVG